MTGHLGFSYIGLIFLLLIFIPNIIWTRKKPKGYIPENENKILLFFEKLGQILTTTCCLIFNDFDFVILNSWSNWTWWLIAAFALMMLYELWWIRYFKNGLKLSDFYSSFMGIPLAGATLPVLSFFLLGIYGKVIWLVAAATILGIGHIGIHLQHSKEFKSF